MALHNDILANLSGHSVGMYSTWFYYKPARLMLDAGEGVSVAMRNHVFGIETVLLTHGHYDHIGGLAGLIYTRAAARGDKEKPLTVYYPAGWRSIRSFVDFVNEAAGARDFDLRWEPVVLNRDIVLGEGKDRPVVRPFEVTHSTQGRCFGYKLIESRTRLRHDLAGKTEDEISQIAREKGSGAVRENYQQITLAYCGDSYPVEINAVRGAEVLMHEATFMNAGERRGNSHSTVEDAILVAMRASVKCLVIYHASSRYSAKEVEDAVRKKAQELGCEIPIGLYVGRKFLLNW